MPRIILASQSPRRRQLLAQVGIRDFEVLVPQADESYDPALPPEEIVASICRRKAESARNLVNDHRAIIIAADTMVFLGGLRLGKPRDQVDAFTMLSALSGRIHQVCTGVTVCRGERMETRAETTAVTFRPLTQDEIWGYIRSGEPMDKAGAYGIQGLGSMLVQGIRGDYFNVMGLPVCAFGQALETFGLFPLLRRP